MFKWFLNGVQHPLVFRLLHVKNSVDTRMATSERVQLLASADLQGFTRSCGAPVSIRTGLAE